MVDYENGLLPPSLLRRVSNFRPLTSRVNSNVGSDLLREDAWAAATMLQVAFLDHFGRSLNISEAYRGRTLQTAFWNEYQAGVGNLAAVPGTSNHGWGISIDFGSGVGTYGSAAKVWMDANAPRYGWWPEGNGFSRREGWHFLFRPKTATVNIPASGDLSPFPTSPTSPPVIPINYGENDMPFLIGKKTSAEVAIVGVPGPGVYVFPSIDAYNINRNVHNDNQSRLAGPGDGYPWPTDLSKVARYDDVAYLNVLAMYDNRR